MKTKTERLIKALYNVTKCKDQIRPAICGVHHHKEREQAIIINGVSMLMTSLWYSPELAGMTITETFQKSNAEFPNINTIVPVRGDTLKVNFDIKFKGASFVFLNKVSGEFSECYESNKKDDYIKLNAKLLKPLFDGATREVLVNNNMSPVLITVSTGTQFLIMPIKL